MLLVWVSGVFPCHTAAELSLLELFKTRNDLSSCCAHESETGTDESARELKLKKWRKREEKKTVLHPVASRGRTLATGFTVQRASQPATTSHGNMGLYAHRSHSGLVGTGKMGGQDVYI